ncbi:MAG: phosphate signaling complex protein PhoU [bacterium]
MPTHYEKSLQRDIDLIRYKVIEMGERVENALRTSLQAMTESNRQLAYTVILQDRYIDELEKAIDRLCLEFLVRQQPAAGHLRFVYAAIKINNELERIGDYAESIARQFLSISSLDPQPKFDKIVIIADLAIPMFRNAMQSFIEKDAELAKATIKTEDKVDEARTKAHDKLLNRHEKDKLPLEALPPMMIIVSRFERVADQACNICEEVLYMCTGQDIKHKGKEAFRVLFVDEFDSCRGQMAVGIATSLGAERFVFSSAGLNSREVDPKTIEFMAGMGIDISHQKSKSLNHILNLEHYDVIISLCKEAEVAFPPSPTKTVSIRWHIDDPSQIKGKAEEKKRAYEKTYHFLDTNIHDLVEAIIVDEINNHSSLEEKK